MTATHNSSAFPLVGSILNFAMKCFSLTRAEAGLTPKQVQRLATGKEMKPETMEKIARKVLYALYTHVTGKDDSSIDQVFGEWTSRGGIDQYLPSPSANVVYLNRDQVLRDSLELCIRQNHLIQLCQSIVPSKAALGIWIEHVLWPYITSTYVDYVLAENNPDEGMPGGDIWVLPSENYDDSDPDEPVWIWPTQKVLSWWQDLLGDDLKNLRDKLGGAARGDTPRRCIDRWMSGGNIDFQTIERWSHQKWDYKGAFTDDPNLPLSNRWNKCRRFLESKGYASRPDQLGEQIPGISGIVFDTFFQCEQPDIDGHLIERIINQVARRWKTPTNETLRARLLIARAANWAWKESLESFGPFKTRSIRGSFAWLYNRYLDVCTSTRREDMNGKLQRHMELEKIQPSPYAITAGAMLNRECEALLPSELKILVSIAENIDDEALCREMRNHFPGKSQSK